MDTFCYMQLQTQDKDRAEAFYEKLFQWKLERTPGYSEVKTGGLDAGVMKSPAPQVPSFWLPYVAVADLGKTLAAAQELGAKVVVPPTDVPGKGKYAVFSDPTGAMMAIWVVTK
jgi:predicted enzyme related to lactoylglutathione lyase